MHKVIKPFTFYHDGINPTAYEAGEQELPADAAEVALSEGWAELAETKAEGFIAKHRGGGKWDVFSPAGEVVADGLSKDEAKAKADELNAEGQ